MPSGQRSGGEWFPVFILVVLVALFLGGAILLRQQFQAAAKTNGAAFISGFAFATFPFWFVPLTLPLIIVIVDKCG